MSNETASPAEPATPSPTLGSGPGAGMEATASAAPPVPPEGLPPSAAAAPLDFTVDENDGDPMLVLPSGVTVSIALLRSCKTAGGALAAEAALRYDLTALGLTEAQVDAAVAVAAGRLV